MIACLHRLSVRQSVRLYVCLSICQSVCTSVSLLAWLSGCLVVFLIGLDSLTLKAEISARKRAKRTKRKHKVLKRPRKEILRNGERRKSNLFFLERFTMCHGRHHNLDHFYRHFLFLIANIAWPLMSLDRHGYWLQLIAFLWLRLFAIIMILINCTRDAKALQEKIAKKKAAEAAGNVPNAPINNSKKYQGKQSSSTIA